MKRISAIKKFLNEKESSLKELFNEEMEIQLNVGIDSGIKIQRIFKFEDKEITYTAFTNCLIEQHHLQFGVKESWKAIR
ncbi:MAG: hypothetical protein AABY22_35735, partial [Nanoarchaeota archaeon]